MSQDPNYSTSDGREIYTEGTNPPDPDLQSHLSESAPVEYNGPSVGPITDDEAEQGRNAYEQGQDRLHSIEDAIKGHGEDPHTHEETYEPEFGPGEGDAFGPSGSLDSSGSGLDSLGSGLESADLGLGSSDLGLDSFGSSADSLDQGFDPSGSDSSDSGLASDDPGWDSGDPGMGSADQDYESA
jgi:hypothetical protein